MDQRIMINENVPYVTCENGSDIEIGDWILVKGVATNQQARQVVAIVADKIYLKDLSSSLAKGEKENLELMYFFKGQKENINIFSTYKTDNPTKYDGYLSYNMQVNKLAVCRNGKMIDAANGYPLVKSQGATNERPTLQNNDSGFLFFDTTIKKPIWWDGTRWVDSTGAVV